MKILFIKIFYSLMTKFVCAAPNRHHLHCFGQQLFALLAVFYDLYKRTMKSPTQKQSEIRHLLIPRGSIGQRAMFCEKISYFLVVGIKYPIPTG